MARLLVIPFYARIEGSGDVKNYADFLVSEAAPSIMAWIIEGAKKAISRNFHIPCPACVEGAIKSYREENDWLGHFMHDCCEVERGGMAKSGEVYREYRVYCQQTGEYTRSTAVFFIKNTYRGLYGTIVTLKLENLKNKRIGDICMREKIIEQKFREAVKAVGGVAVKFTSPGWEGMPDRNAK